MKTKPVNIKLLGWLQQAESSIPEMNWRTEALEDYKFYSGEQDDPEVIALLAEQKRVNATFNEIKPKIDMLIGMAAQAKWDVKAVPREVNDEVLAEIATKFLKYARDKAKFVDIEIDTFEHTVKSGRSFIYFYVDAENPFQPQVKAKRYPGEHVYVDPNSVEYDLSDARYVMIEKWMTEEDMRKYWPDETALKAVSGGSGVTDKLSFFNEMSDKYRIIECWYKDYEKRLWFHDPITGKETQLKHKDFAAYTKQLAEGVEIEGEVVKIPEPIQAYESVVEFVKYSIFTGFGTIEEGYSPYRLKTFPIVLCGAYKNNDENRWISVTNQMKDPQRSQNTMRRQLLHLLQTLPKGILTHEAGAVLNIEEYEQRAADPTYHMELARGGLQQIKFQQQPSISPVYQQLDAIYGQAMKNASGIHNEMMGVQTTSREPGVTVRARQETGVAVLFVLFDNLRRTRQQAAKVYFQLLQQYTTTPTLFRVLGEQDSGLVEINTQMNPSLGGFNDISAVEFDLIFDDAVFTSSERAAITQMLIDYSHNNPGMIPPDLILEYSTVPWSVKQKIKQHYEMQQQAAAEAAKQEQLLAEAELLLKEKEVEIKQQDVNNKKESNDGN